MDKEVTASVSAPCFMSDHEGFYGSIKNSTRDFIVTERNINGHLVNERNVLENVSPADFSGQTCAEKESKTDENVKPSPIDIIREDNFITAEGDVSDVVACQNTEIDTACEEPIELDVVFGQSVNEALEQFAASVELHSAPRLDKAVASAELSLGSFPEKHQRATVHRAVRHNFPFLMTVTNGIEIIVKKDPHYLELAQLVSEEEAHDFFRFIDAKVPNTLFTFKKDDNKEHRKAVHHFLSRRFGKLVETKSFSDVSSGGSQTTAITVRFRERSKPAKKRTAADCQEESLRYTGFTLKKENLETLEAINYMATGLGVLPSDFTYAGIKDKRALTYQSMVVKKVSPDRLKEKSPEFEKRGIQLSHIRSVPEPLHLGRLQGNHFQLIIRDLRPHRADSPTGLGDLVQEAVDNVKVKGFVNFYGPQRFGASQSVQADEVGLALLKEEMVTAVRLFFTPDEGDDPQNRAKNHFLQTENAKESLALMPEHKVRERLMLRALHRYGMGQEGCARGWLSLPHGMRVFYIHAYCSRVWNQAAAFRLQRLGRGPGAVQGDLVWSREARDEGTEHDPQQVHIVTAAEEADNVYSLRQVILPMPGNSVKYPENAVGAWYRERLAKDGLANCRYRVTQLKLNIPGCYRPLLVYPRNLTHEVQGHTEQPSDEGSLAPPAGSSLALSFDLDASCYATVCLREIMKCDP